MMENTPLPMRIIVFAVVLSSVKCSRHLHLGASLLNQQLRLLEQIIVVSEPSNGNATHFIQTHELPEDAEKRLLVRIRCSEVAKTKMLTHLQRYNHLLDNYLNVLFPKNQADFEAVKAKAVIDELTKNTQNLREFCLYELPSLYFRYGQDLGLNFNQEELERRAQFHEASRQWRFNATMEKFSGADKLEATTDFSRFF